MVISCWLMMVGAPNWLSENFMKNDVKLDDGLALNDFKNTPSIAKIPHLKTNAKTDEINSCAVIGGGLMGTGIATALLKANLSVVLIDRSNDVLKRARQSIEATFAKDVKRGRITKKISRSRLGLLQISQTIEDVKDADLIIEAVFEQMDVKKQVFEAIDLMAKKTAILASNTSSLDLDTIANFTNRPEQVVGLHFFSPANIMKLLEIVRGDRTDENVLAAALSFAKQINKIGVVAGNCDGFIGNRMFEEYLRQAYFLLEEGALPHQVDNALEQWGMAMGPLKTMDLAGQDIGYEIRKRRMQVYPDQPYSKIPDLICEMGRYGQKTGAGFYLYPNGRKPVPDPKIDQMIQEHSHSIGCKRREISDNEILERCIGALINEGAKILSEGMAYRCVDVDMVWLHGYGFPKERGGPMFYADRMGPDVIHEQLKRYSKQINGRALKPSALFSSVVTKGMKISEVEHG